MRDMMNEAVSDDVDRDKLTAALDQVNRARLGLRTGDDPAAIERDIEDMFRPFVKLAIYGTLAPGKANHHYIGGLGGAWQDAAVRGSLGRVPCGMHGGLPAMLLDPASPLQTLKLLPCEGLPSACTR